MVYIPLLKQEEPATPISPISALKYLVGNVPHEELQLVVVNVAAASALVPEAHIACTL